MKYRLIVSDIDGTLTDQWTSVIKKNQEVLQRLVTEQDVKFMIATGRNFRGAKPILEALDFECWACLINGALLLTYPELEMIHSNYLSSEEKNLILEKVIEAEGNILIYNGYERGDKVYYSNQVEHNLVMKKILETSEDKILIEDLIEEIEHPVPVISCIGKEEKIDEIYQNLMVYSDKFNILKLVDQEHPGYNWLMVTRRGVDKVHGIQLVADKLGIEREEILAIGDDLNDIEMIKYAGLGIAMENGVEQLKEAADLIAPSCSENGLARVLEDIFLK